MSNEVDNATLVKMGVVKMHVYEDSLAKKPVAVVLVNKWDFEHLRGRKVYLTSYVAEKDPNQQELALAESDPANQPYQGVKF